MDINGDFTSGFQYYYKFNERFNINPRYATSGNMTEFSMGAPIQLYKSENNQFGLKFTPFLNYLKIDSMTIDKQQYPVKDHFMNFGARISAGYPLEHTIRPITIIRKTGSKVKNRRLNFG